MSSLRVTVFLIGLLCVIGSHVAQGDIYRFKDENGVWHFSDINNDARYKLFIKTYAKKPEKYIHDFGWIIDQASEKYDVDPSFIKAVIKAESDFDTGAVSSKGAQGLMQLMPKTADAMDVDNPFNPEENIHGGTRYLRLLLDRYSYDRRLALAAYNAGPTRVDEYNGVPPFEETENFIERVLNYYEDYQNEDI